MKERKEQELVKFKDFIADGKSSGKGMMIHKKMVPSGNTAIEEKYITIEKVPLDLQGRIP